jgi:cytochrome c-type biogenesis protein CcmH/NrfG
MPVRCTGMVLLILSMAVPARAATPAASDPQTRAASALEDDLKTDPNNAELWLHLGFAYRKISQIDKAQTAFEKATSLSPNMKDAYFMLGLIYESKHMDEQAQKAWKSYMTAETDPDRRAIAQKHIHHLAQ